MQTGFAQIDALLGGQSSASLDANNCTADTVGFIQDLLIGQGFRQIPGPLAAARGRYGSQTTSAVRDFQRAQNLPLTGVVDLATLRAFMQADWPHPLACCGYVALVLEVAFIGMARLVSITSQFEGAGLFTALNRNTDKAGLSFGLIQWAQKPGRLNQLLKAIQSAEPALFVEIFGDGDQAVATGLLAHTAKTRGGTDATGNTTDPRFDLIRAPWDGRFLAAGRHRDLQRVQLDVAVADFEKSFARLQMFAPQIRSERGVAFMLDLANQHGDGGAQSIMEKVQQPGLSEPALLAAAEEESVARVRAQFGDGRPEVASTRNRRQAFRTTTLLGEDPIVLT